MTCLTIRTLLVPYLDNELTQGERATLERHIAGCPACASEVSTLAATQKRTTAALNHAVSTIYPSPHAWEMVERRLEQKHTTPFAWLSTWWQGITGAGQERRTSLIGQWGSMAPAGAMIALAIALFFAYNTMMIAPDNTDPAAPDLLDGERDSVVLHGEPTRTPTVTVTPTREHDATRTPNSEPTRTPRATRTPRPDPTRTTRPTEEPEATRIIPPEKTRTPNAEPTRTGTPRPDPTRTAEPTRTVRPTDLPDPTRTPNTEPTRTVRPTHEPDPTRTPNTEPTRTVRPTEQPEVTRTPNSEPTRTPRPEPTEGPSPTGIPDPTRTPNSEPTVEPTTQPDPTRTPGPAPTEGPPATNVPDPTRTPNSEPTVAPTTQPDPTRTPGSAPTEGPPATNVPDPTRTPNSEPTAEPTNQPDPTQTPGNEPTEGPPPNVPTSTRDSQPPMAGRTTGVQPIPSATHTAPDYRFLWVMGLLAPLSIVVARGKEKTLPKRTRWQAKDMTD